MFHLSDLQPENVLAVEVEGYTVPEIKLIHFERSREVNTDNDVIIKRLDDHIEYEGMSAMIGECVLTQQIIRLHVCTPILQLRRSCWMSLCLRRLTCGLSEYCSTHCETLNLALAPFDDYHSVIVEINNIVTTH